MQESLNTFIGGMNQDLSLLKDRSNTYWDALNVRILTDIGASSGAVENIKGNVWRFKLDDGRYIVGWCSVRDEIIIFATDSNTGFGNSYIYRLDYSSYSVVDEVIVNTSNTVDSPIANSNFELIYTDVNKTNKLNFSLDHPIKAIGIYETDSIRKVYWTDNYNYLRTLNVQDLIDTYGTSLNPDPNTFDIISDFDHPVVIPTGVGYGQLKVGKVSYSCQLYNLYGKQSCYTIPTVSTILTNGDEGDKEGEISGKSVSLKISNINPNSGSIFNRIRVVSIHYGNYYAAPEIKIIFDGEIPTTPWSTIYITDDGTVSLGTYTQSEFQLISKTLFTCKALESKDSVLFAGNITNTNFEITDDEFDARTYRFGTLNTSRVYESNGSYYIVNSDGTWSKSTGESGSNWSIPSNADIIMHKEHSSGYDQYSQKYRYYNNSSDYAIGGSGKYINYNIKFSTDKIIVDENSTISKYEFFSKSQNGWSHHFSEKLLGYQRDEVYRFGIVFFDKKGRESFVKWIGDIKFPHISELNASIFPHTKKSGDRQYANIPYIEFNVTIPDVVADKISGFSIVRCERKDEDKTILAQGTMGLLYYLNDPSIDPFNGFVATERLEGCDFYFNTPTGYVVNKIVNEFISPEINFLNKPNYIDGSYLEWIGKLNTYHTASGHRNFNYDKTLSVSKLSEITSEKDTLYRRDIEDFKICKSSFDNNYIINASGNSANVYLSLYSLGSPSEEHATHGTCGMLSINSEFIDNGESYEPFDINTGVNTGFLMNLKVPQSSQYNGNTYSARANSKYIPCNHFTTPGSIQLEYDGTNGMTKHIYYVGSSGTYTAYTFGGDTYISMFCYLRSIWSLEQEDEKSWREVIMLPLETTVNTDVRYGDYPTRNNNLYLQEFSGSYLSNFNSSTDEEYIQEHNCYEYNTAYSRNNNAFLYVSEPFNFTSEDVFDTMVRYSLKKYNAETIDNWTVFLPNNFNEADTRYGGINVLALTGQNLAFLQDRATGIWSVNERSLISDNNGLELALGNGAMLDRYYYLSTQSGCSHRFGYVVYGNELYYIDSVNKKMMVLSNDSNALSDVKGMGSWFKNNIADRLEDNILKGKGIVGTKDVINNEVMFSIQNSNIEYVKWEEQGIPFDFSVPNTMAWNTRFAKVDVVLASEDDVTNDVIMVYLGFANTVISGLHNGTHYFIYNTTTNIWEEVYPGSHITYQIKTGDSNTIVFNKMLNIYTSFSSADSSLWLSDFNSLLSTYNGSEIYVHNYGYYGKFYDRYFNSSITPVINPKALYTKSYTNLFYYSEVIVDDIEQPEDTLTRYRITNNYQSTGWLNVDANTVKRKYRKWRIQIPRALYDMNNNDVRSDYSRIISPYIKVDLEFNNSLTPNTGIRRFILHDIVSSFILYNR